MSKYKTNLDKVAEVMNFSQAGAMSQVIVMEAIRAYLSNFEEDNIPEPQEGDETKFIDPVFYHKCCLIVKDEFEHLNTPEGEKKDE